MGLLRTAAWLLTWLWVAAAGASAADEAARLAEQRRALEQGFEAEERGCTTRFAVNACLEEVQARRRTALAPLREAELRLAEAERQRRADVRRAAISRKQEAVAARLAASAADAGAAPAAASVAGSAPPQPLARPLPDPTSPARTAPTAQQAAEAARRAAGLREAREKAEAAEARIQERRQRQQERLARRGRQPDTLPAPAAPPASNPPGR